MKAVILSGGEGTRLRAVSGGLPKPLMPILGTPLLLRTAALLRDNGFTDLCLTLCHKGDMIRNALGTGGSLGVRIQYRLEDPKKPLGTAGAVKNCRDFLGTEPFLVISGDSACDFDLARLMARHRGGVTIALTDRAVPLAYGLVVTGADGVIAGFLEKPDWEQVVTDRISTGIYVLDPDILDCIPEDTACDFGKDLFPALLKKGVPMRGEVMDGYWRDIGTPRDYYQTNLDVLDGLYRLPGEVSVTRRVLPCQNRARLMRAMSEALVEFGADFSHGLTLQTERGTARVSPLSEEEALCFDGDTAAVRQLETLAQKFRKELEGR